MPCSRARGNKSPVVCCGGEHRLYLSDDAFPHSSIFLHTMSQSNNATNPADQKVRVPSPTASHSDSGNVVDHHAPHGS